MNWRTARLIVICGAAAARLAHLAFYLAGPLSRIWYQPVLGAYRFETSALEILGGVPQDAPYLYASPIFTYLVLPFYALGAGRLPLLLTQAALGAITALLIVRLAEKAGASPPAGALAGLAWSLYGPVVFMEMTVLPVTLAALTTAAITLAAVSGETRVVPVLLCGAGAGVLAGIRAPMAVVLIPVLASLRMPGRPFAARVATGAGSLALAGLVLLPLALHQRAHFAGFYPFPRSGGFNLALGHNDDASGYGPPAPSLGLVESSREDIGLVAMRIAFEHGATDFVEADEYWNRTALGWIAVNPVREAELTLRKLGGFLGFRPFDVYYDLSRLALYNPSLGVIALPRALIVLAFCVCLLPFAAGGRHRTALLLPIGASLLTSIVFVHSERFFIPALPVMLAVTAAGASTLVGSTGGARARLAILALAGLIPASAAVLRPVPVVPEGIFLQSMGTRAYNDGDAHLALTFYERAALASPPGSMTRYESHMAAAAMADLVGERERAEEHRALALLSVSPPE